MTFVSEVCSERRVVRDMVSYQKIDKSLTFYYLLGHVFNVILLTRTIRFANHLLRVSWLRM